MAILYGIFHIEDSFLLIIGLFVLGIPAIAYGSSDVPNQIPEKTEIRKDWDEFTLVATGKTSVKVGSSQECYLCNGDSVLIKPEPIRSSPMRGKKIPQRDTDLRLIAKIEDPIEKQVKKDMKRLKL